MKYSALPCWDHRGIKRSAKSSPRGLTFSPCAHLAASRVSRRYTPRWLQKYLMGKKNTGPICLLVTERYKRGYKHCSSSLAPSPPHARLLPKTSLQAPGELARIPGDSSGRHAQQSRGAGTSVALVLPSCVLVLAELGQHREERGGRTVAAPRRKPSALAGRSRRGAEAAAGSKSRAQPPGHGTVPLHTSGRSSTARPRGSSFRLAHRSLCYKRWNQTGARTAPELPKQQEPREPRGHLAPRP